MIEWLRKRPLSTRVLVYAVAAVLAFAVAASVGAVTALMLQSGPSVPPAEGGPAGGQGGDPEGAGGAGRAQQEGQAGQEEAAPGQEEAAPGQEEAAPGQDGDVDEQEEGGDARLGEEEYLRRVGAIQGEAVETFADSHEKLLAYDALTARDVDAMRANEAALEELARRAGALSPPRGHEDHHGVFASAVGGLREAAGEAHELANDPVAAAEVGFDGYDARVERVGGLLERSNTMAGRDYETIGDPREISPQLGAAGPAARGPQEDAAHT
jgi:hypothetical protein